MKRIIFITLLLFMATIVSVAQERARFMGIPIQGSVEDFANKLVKEKGFVIADVNDYENVNYIMETKKLIGTFEGFDKCNVYVRLMTDSLKEVSSVLVEVDTLKYKKRFFDSIVGLYDEKYGAHSGTDEYSWVIEGGNISLGIDGGKYYVVYMNSDEVKIHINKQVEGFKQKLLDILMDSAKERQTVKEICGIPFGTSYEEANRMLENKYGYSEYNPDKTLITYKNKSYGGIMFDAIHFLFESDGINSYLNGCTFILSAETLKEAERKRDMLYKKLEDKYHMLKDVDENGNVFYVGGYAPIGEGLAFSIDILKYERKLARLYTPYAARLMYGRYHYVKEEF